MVAMITKLRNILLVLILLASAGNTANISMRLDSIGLSIYQKLWIGTSGNERIPDSVRNTAINESITQICHDFPAIEKTDTISLVAATKGIALNGDFLRVNWVFKFGTKDDNPMLIPLQYAPVGTLFEARAQLAGAEQKVNDESAPRYYFTWNDLMYFYPQPGEVDSVILAYYAMDTLLQVAASITQILPQYRDAIIHLSCYKLALIQERFTVAQAHLIRYNELLGLSATKPEKKQE